MGFFFSAFYSTLRELGPALIDDTKLKDADISLNDVIWFAGGSACVRELVEYGRTTLDFWCEDIEDALKEHDDSARAARAGADRWLQEVKNFFARLWLPTNGWRLKWGDRSVRDKLIEAAQLEIERYQH